MTLDNGLGQMNIIPQQEDNFSIVAEDTDIWTGELPYKSGDIFPTPAIKERAMTSATNRLIYDNDVENIYANIISVFPEIDPMYGWQIREIITNLPLFKNSTNYWVGLVAGDAPLVDIDGPEDNDIAHLLDTSNFAETLQNEVRSRFLDQISAYRVDLDLNGIPRITMIEAKNLVCFVNRDTPTFIEVNVVFSIYTKSGVDYIDFVEYHYDGKIVKHTFTYGGNAIGERVGEPITEQAFEGKFKASPIVVFKHNVINNAIYGTDQYRYWSASMLAVMRCLQNVLRLGERTREMIRKVPNSAIKKNPVDGSSVFVNKGTIGYSEGADKSPDIEYVTPEIRMQEAIAALESAQHELAADTQLGVVFFNVEALGSRLSADSLKAAMYPARIEAKRITSEMKPSVKELIIKLGYLLGYDLDGSKISVEFYDGFPSDPEERKLIMERFTNDKPSLSLEDAIMKLDRVPLRVARKKAQELTGKVEQGTSNSLGTVISSTIKPSAGEGTVNVSQENFVDDTVWDNQMVPIPHDIPQGNYSKGAKEWAFRRFRKKD
mgnify:FL=1